jgi:hypothetical protein
MQKIVIWIIAMNFLLPVWTWGEEDYGDITGYRYNPIENQWKVRANKCTIKYNPMEDHWTYVYPGEVLRFNPAENNWDYQSIEKRLRYDIISEKWFYGYSLLKNAQEHPGALSSTSPRP